MKEGGKERATGILSRLGELGELPQRLISKFDIK